MLIETLNQHQIANRTFNLNPHRTFDGQQALHCRNYRCLSDFHIPSSLDDPFERSSDVPLELCREAIGVGVTVDGSPDFSAKLLGNGPGRDPAEEFPIGPFTITMRADSAVPAMPSGREGLAGLRLGMHEVCLSAFLILGLPRRIPCFLNLGFS